MITYYYSCNHYIFIKNSSLQSLGYSHTMYLLEMRRCFYDRMYDKTNINRKKGHSMQTLAREKQVKKVVRMRKLAAFSAGKSKNGTERFIDTSHGKVRVLEYGFNQAEITPLYIDMHGGGFVFLKADADEAMNTYFNEQTGVKIVSIDYPKAPEKPYPAAVEAVYEIALHYVGNAAEYGIDPTRVGIGGHSAGANLATVTCIRAKEKGDLSIKLQILDYPPLDIHTDPFLKPTPKKAISPKMAVMFNACYVEPERASEPYVSPVFAAAEQLMGLPTALVIVAGQDSLHDEGVRYADLLKDAGVAVELHDFKSSAHGFTYDTSPEAKRAHKLMADFLKNHI